ncbi:HpcH/HpaI aldolase/citrate lyase family protein [Acuticoccus kandeliae]|uniref:HpcH/HpaI aldolase/citrate lyase family protein n=1 Tax=Acuticoccus kandeliae TaxID=2073160 RepID=UPI000D3E5AE2|nr:CoA ester lyase [Acuticoccus kandeliae]
MSQSETGSPPAPRSYLFVPATSERKLEKAFASAADAVIIDLEDAVANAEKPAARETVARVLAAPLPRPVFVRVNGLGTPYCWEDLAAIASPHITGIVLPKVEAASDLLTADWVLSQHEAGKGLAVGAIRVQPILETAKGVQNAPTIATATARTDRLFFGAVDLAADMGLDISGDEGAVQSARWAIALASRAAGLPGPVDTAYVNIKAIDLLVATAGRARAMGYTGKACIHPDQIAPVNTAFSPTAEEISKAERIVDAFDAAEHAGAAAVSVDGMMVDYPVVAWARGVLAQVQAR